MAKSPFPKEILVTQQRPKNDDPYLSLAEGIEMLDAEEDAGEKVAVYHLVEVRAFKVTRKLE